MDERNRTRGDLVRNELGVQAMFMKSCNELNEFTLGRKDLLMAAVSNAKKHSGHYSY